jgi:hypothetical protein
LNNGSTSAKAADEKVAHRAVPASNERVRDFADLPGFVENNVIIHSFLDS